MRIATRLAPSSIAGMEAFTTHGAMHASRNDYTAVGGHVQYEIWSYDVVIGIVDYHGDYVSIRLNPRKYSATTSRHQSTMRRGLATLVSYLEADNVDVRYDEWAY